MGITPNLIIINHYLNYSAQDIHKNAFKQNIVKIKTRELKW